MLAEISGMDARLAAARGGRAGRADRRPDDPRLPPGAGRRGAPRSSSPTPRTAPTRRPRRWPASSVVELTDASGNGDVDLARPRAAPGRRRRGVHDHQPEHARPVRGADPPRSPRSCHARAGWSTATAPTSTRSSASRAPATWASTSCTSTCTRPSPRRTAAAAPARARSASRSTWRRSCRRRSWSRTATSTRFDWNRPAVHRQAPGVLGQLRHAGARLHLHPHHGPRRAARRLRERGAQRQLHPERGSRATYDRSATGPCMHECVLSARRQKKLGVTAHRHRQAPARLRLLRADRPTSRSSWRKR